MTTFPDDLELDADDRVKDDASPYPMMVAAGLLVVMMVCSAGFSVWTLHERVDREARASLEKLSLVISEQTSRSFQSVNLVLKDLVGRVAAEGHTTSDALRGGQNGRATHKLLEDKAFGLPQIGNLLLVDSDGKVFNTSQIWPAPAMSIADRAYFKYLRDNDHNGLFISDPVLSKYDGEWTLMLARRLNAADGSFIGIVLAGVRLKHFEEFYGSVNLGDGSSISLLRQDRTLLARYPVVENMIGRRIGEPNNVRTVESRVGSSNILDSSIDGTVRYVSVSPVAGFPLAVSTALAKDVVMRTWRQDATILLIGALAAVAGVVLLFVMLMRKIRRARDSEVLLTRQNARFADSRRQLLDAQRVGKCGHWVADATGANAVWSPQLFDIAGLPPTPNVPFATLQSLVHPDDLDAFLTERDNARVHGIRMLHENRWIRPDGEIRWVRLEADPRKDADGRVVGLFGIVQDITERKQAELAAFASQHLLIDAIESISQGFVLYDKEDRFVLANSRFRAMFPTLSGLAVPGMRYEELLRAGYERGLFATAGLNGESSEEWLARTLAWHQAANEPLERLSENGRWVSLVDCRTSDGSIVGLRTDITDYKDIEAALEQRVADLEQVRLVLEAQKDELETTSEHLTASKEAAEAASRAKSDFLAVMSHEIRTPMSGMVGMIDLLRDTPLTEEQQRYAALAKESANGLLEVTNDILDFSKLEAGELKPESIDFDIEHVINGAAALMKAKAHERSLEVRTSLAPGLPKWLKGDPNRVRQVILNLVNNAIKFTEHGSVAIKASHRHLDAGKIELLIEIVDTGIGIPLDVQGKLFNPFVQADTSISRKYGGTGLGLAICRQLCTMMGGAIGVRSEHERGSTFWFTVACGAGTPTAAKKKVAELEIEGDLFLDILVAEDSPIIAMLISTLLSKRSYGVHLVGNGRLALEAVQRKSYDLVLMDVQMPEMDGISATKAIRALPGQERDIPIIALTANAFVGQRETYLAAGMNDYVTKPIQPAALFAAINRCSQPRVRAVEQEPELTA
jgi:PAS domain S-box-containing protein